MIYIDVLIISNMGPKTTVNPKTLRFHYPTMNPPNRWFSRCVMAAMLMDEQKKVLSLPPFVRPTPIVHFTSLLSVSGDLLQPSIYFTIIETKCATSGRNHKTSIVALH